MQGTTEITTIRILLDIINKAWADYFPADILTGTTTLIGHFEGNMEVEALVIPYTPPIHYLFADHLVATPSIPRETILFNASESFGSNPIILYEWDWDTDGNYDDTLPFQQ